ncbi:MAG: hypothetical protein GX806_01655, partial [Lentisphaerae bacterium]|nr:hypothetical protein [Lentisphaerota bacterium]
EGLRYNPRNAGLHWELGWIYQHKIGFILDRAHWVYKRKLAEEMGRFFEGAAPDYATLASDPRAELMRNAAKLEPAVMAAIDEQYGPLDWRLPAAHALYWAYCGRQLTTAPDAWRRNCDHMICQCSADLFRHGQLTLTDDLYFTAPDLDLLPKVLGAFESALYSHPQEQLFAFAYINFISQAMLITYAFNQLEPARELFATLQANYPGADSLDFETTAEGLLDARLADMPFVMAVPLIEGFLFQYYYWQAGGESQRAGACAKRAGEIWEHYMATRVDEEHRAQTGLPPLAAIRRHAWQRAWQEVPAAWQGPLLALLPADEAVAGQR